ncbi:unnamed protein product [Kluyveromyces dobzhanskii CBS 2104]|uniref:WGS project CCBQ000000000 data, contig 00099 n=1 Tax=Kluyveromyces dobzhanskii CBS 2104 TaxID=1427455 RepID=A0A0A8L4M4_9SACH|nr:unnamed protein product [Kluyveromyces dobzhanskii CBS 2104]
MNTIYVYAGDNKPKVELNKIKNVPRIEEIVMYLHRMQDVFQLQLRAVETITGNLKIKSCSHSDEVDDHDKPFYILEYCVAENSYSLWKSRSEWKLSAAIATLYGRNSLEDLPGQLLECLTDPCQISTVSNLLKEFNIKDATKINWETFATDLVQFFGTHPKKPIDLNQLKTSMALSLLKSMVVMNKRDLESILVSYDVKVHQDNSPVSSPTPTSTEPSKSMALESDYTHMSSTQLQSNFSTFFQSMAENFETYDTEKQPTIRSLKLPPLAKTKKKPAGQVYKPAKKGHGMSTN